METKGFVMAAALALGMSGLATAPATASGDAKPSATPINVGQVVKEPLESRTDTDWFKFTVPSRHEVVVTLSDQPKWASVALYNPDSLGGERLDYDYDSDTDPAPVTASARVEAGTYYILVEADDYTSGGSRPTYSLRVDASPRLPDNGPNTKYSAASVPLGQAITETLDASNDVDWYRFDIPQKSKTTLTLSGQPRYTDMSLVQDDSRGGSVIDSAYSSSSSGPPPVSISADLEAGVYFVVIEADGAYDDVNPYTLRVDAAAERSPSAVSLRRKGRGLRVNVDPDQAAADYRVQIRKKVGGTWRKVRTVKTKGTNDTRTLKVGKGRYRAVVPAQLGLLRSKSGVVRV